MKYTFQWERCDAGGGSCGSISGAVNDSYGISSADNGLTLRVLLTASNQNGSATALSSPTSAVTGSTQPPATPTTGTTFTGTTPISTTTPTTATTTTTTTTTTAAPTSPSDSSLPTVSGVPQQGQSLNASPGSWTGTSPMGYAFQWMRCNSSGGSCSAVNNATASTYSVTSTDLGGTLRVTVTATNTLGSAAASSNATSAVGSTTATPTFVGDFETGSFSPWDHIYDPNPSSANPPSIVTSPTAQGGYAAKLTVDPNDTFITGTNNTSSRVDVYQNSNSNLAREGLDEWVHMNVMFPAWNGSSGYKPTNGEWNWFHQWHSDDSFPESTTGGQPLALGVVTGGALSQCYGDTSSSANPQIFGYINGGDVAKGTTGQTRFCLHQALQYGHWYDLSEHIVWSKSATTGYYALYLDGALVTELHQPTLLYNSSTGTVDVPNLELDNYRWNMNGAVNWSSTIYFDAVRVGPTQASVS
jgi:Polysaccharide lyase